MQVVVSLFSNIYYNFLKPGFLVTMPDEFRLAIFIVVIPLFFPNLIIKKSNFQGGFKP